MINKICSEAEERFELEGKTIGEDIRLNEVATALLRVFVDLKRPEVEERISKYEGKRFSDYGKMKLLEEIEEWL